MSDEILRTKMVMILEKPVHTTVLRYIVYSSRLGINCIVSELFPGGMSIATCSFPVIKILPVSGTCSFVHWAREDECAAAPEWRSQWHDARIDTVWIRTTSCLRIIYIRHISLLPDWFNIPRLMWSHGRLNAISHTTGNCDSPGRSAISYICKA